MISPLLSPLLHLACLIVIFWGLEEARPFLLPICIAGLLAFLMAPLHRLLSKKLRVPDGFAVLITVVVFLSPLVMISVLLVKQGQGLVQDFPQLMASANAKIANFRVNSPLAEHLGINQDFDLNEWFQKLSSGVGQGLGLLVGGLTTVISVGSEAVLILVFSILFLGSRIHLRDASEKILAQYPSCNGPGLIDESVALIQKFLVARMAIVVIIGVLAGFVLFLLGVKYFIFLGAFIGILTLVPAVGGIIGIVVTVVAAIISGHSTTSVLVIASLLLSVSLLEAYVLTPKMVGNRLNINALATFIGLFAGGLLWGVWGMFLSIPILAVMRIVFKTIPSLNAWGELLADEDVVKAKGRVIKPKA